jgi:hypothetical protein
MSIFQFPTVVLSDINERDAANRLTRAWRKFGADWKRVGRITGPVAACRMDLTIAPIDTRQR